MKRSAKGSVQFTGAMVAMTAALGAGTMMSVATARPAHAQPAPYYREWCRNVVGILESALDSGYATSSYEQEKQILMTGITNALTVSEVKHHKFLTITLESAQRDIAIYDGDVDRQVHLLRKYIGWAIEDTRWFDQQRDPSNNIGYVLAMLRRGLDLGAAAPENSEEVAVLRVNAARAVCLIDESDWRRAESNACAVNALRNVLQETDSSAIDETTKVQMLRKVTFDVANRYDGYCRY